MTQAAPQTYKPALILFRNDQFGCLLKDQGTGETWSPRAQCEDHGFLVVFAPTPPGVHACPRGAEALARSHHHRDVGAGPPLR